MSQRTADEEYLLLQSFRRGEEQAFDQIFRDYFASLTYFANQLTHNKAESEDIVQECFLSLWKRRTEISHIESIKTYLYTSVRYKCMQFFTRVKRIESIQDEPIGEPTTEQLIIKTEVIQALYQEIENLTPSRREVIRLYYLEGKNYAEISKILGIGSETVRKHRNRALFVLKKIIISR